MSVANLSTSVETDQLMILCKVSLRGDVPALEALLQEDELILDRASVTCFHETPLHIAAMLGHLHFARALLSRKPKLSNELDSHRRLPLHLASAEGYLDIVKELLDASPDACSARDQEGRIPLHLAAIKGRIDIMKELLRICPDSMTEKLDHGKTILHLCVEYNRLEALKLLVETARDDEFVNASDDNGNTILHLSAILKQVETTKYLLLETSIKTNANALNRNGFTALDAVEHSPKDSKGLEIQIILLEAGVHRNRVLNNLPSTLSSSSAAAANGCYFIRKCKIMDRYFINVGKRLEEARGNILVAATVTASITFQAGISPPDIKADGQKDTNLVALPPVAPENFIDGLQYLTRRGSDLTFWYYNTVSLMLSLVLILLMLSGIPFRNKFSRIFLVVVMCFTVLYISQAYFFAAALHFPEQYQWHSAAGLSLLVIALTVPLLFYSIILLHVVASLIYLVRMIWKFICRLSQNALRFIRSVFCSWHNSSYSVQDKKVHRFWCKIRNKNRELQDQQTTTSGEQINSLI
ncbi:ankyrin repeat-containing protein ITN1 [Ricinus communis]|uniref:ankyrin repeat-containing protein ITN1 n=1 Tax=Ricinus communis TaxID=3988 RepID=UPI00201AF463|nr:ankyrin repeat-containing protein ITN1 [Ricinus communis]